MPPIDSLTETERYNTVVQQHAFAGWELGVLSAMLVSQSMASSPEDARHDEARAKDT
jgi:hypothetical protein